MNKQQEKIYSVKDIQEHQYLFKLSDEIGKGGQGIVFKTQYPDILIKLVNKAWSFNKQNSWLDKIRLLMTQNLHGLNIAYPITLIEQPRAGYVMKLMDGLYPLSKLLEQFQIDGVASYAPTGSLLRRLKILAKLAHTLAELHGRGLVYGDLSPHNIFISQNTEFSEVWLIDCDNISALSRLSQQKIHTPDYGAPEIMREESGINSYTDSWSFAVIAYQLLTGNHPLKGDLVINGDVELENKALRGEIAWVNDSKDSSNHLSGDSLYDLVCDKYLKELFHRCFEAGLNHPAERPGLSEWAEILENTVFHTAFCEECQNTFIAKNQCPFCDTPQQAQSFILFTEYQFIPKSILQKDFDLEIQDKDCWLKTEKTLILNKANSLNFRNFKIYLKDREIIFDNPHKQKFYLQQNKSVQKLPTQFSLSYQGKRKFILRFGELGEVHLVWQFNW